MQIALTDIQSLLVKYETETAVRIWDGSFDKEDLFLHEIVKELRQFMVQILIPDTTGVIIREFVLSNYMKFYDKVPFQIEQLEPLDSGKALVRYKVVINEDVCPRYGNEQKVSTSSGTGVRLKGW